MGYSLRDGGILADIAPTMLDLLGVRQAEGNDRKTIDRSDATSNERLNGFAITGRYAYDKGE